MDKVVPEWVESRFPLYAVSSIHSLYCTSNLPEHNMIDELTVLVAIAAGKGTLRIDDRAYKLETGSIIVLPAHADAVLVAELPQPLHAYKLVIRGVEQHSGSAAGAMMRSSEIASTAAVQIYADEPGIVADIEELYTHRLPVSEMRHVQNQIIFHQLIYRILERQNTELESDEQPSMERSIAYLEHHFAEKITREQLAKAAGVSTSHFSVLFKQHTGFSPSEYLSRLRVHRAKELLISGSGTLREIALKVGYKDEFYLSRRFKQHTGISPSDFTRGKVQQVAVLLAPYASHLLLLGLAPTVTITETSEYVHTVESDPQGMNFIDIRSSAEQLKTVLLSRQVELIIAATEHLREYGLNAEQLRVVAPVVEIAWMEMGWKEHLRLIARAIQRSERAEQWLAEFEQEEQQARQQIRNNPAGEEIISIFVIKPEGVFVYGARNVGYVFYRSLGLRPPALIEAEIRKQGDQFHSVSVELSELDLYAGSEARILVIVYPDEKGNTVHSEQFFESSYWSGLSAVKQKKVDVLHVDDWVPYNPVSVRLQLQRAVDLLTSYQ